MEDKVVIRLPLAKRKNFCPVCSKRMTGHRSCMVMAASPSRSTTAPCTCDAMYCDACDLLFTNINMGKEIFDTTGYLISTFTPDKKCTAEDIRHQMYYEKKTRAAPRPKKELYKGFELVPNKPTIWKPVLELRNRRVYNQACPICGTKLCSDHTLVPISEQQSVKIPGLVCTNCRIMYLKERQTVDEIMRDNPFCKGFTLNGVDLWNASEVEAKQKAGEQQ